MVKEVVLTAVAEEDYEIVLDYLFNKFGILVTNGFIERFEEICLLISQDPEIYPYFDKRKQIRKCVVTKHNMMYFKEYATFIRIITIFDTRQNPDRLDTFI